MDSVVVLQPERTMYYPGKKEAWLAVVTLIVLAIGLMFGWF